MTSHNFWQTKKYKNDWRPKRAGPLVLPSPPPLVPMACFSEISPALLLSEGPVTGDFWAPAGPAAVGDCANIPEPRLGASRRPPDRGALGVC